MAKKATQPMDLTQATTQLLWLDEERLKDKKLIATLQEQTRGQEEQLSQLMAQVQDLQAKMAGVQSLISQAADFEQTVANYKTEMVLLLDQREDAWKKEQSEADRLRKIEQGAVADELSRLDKSVQTISRIEESVKARQAEDQRLNTAIQVMEADIKDLAARSDDRVQAVTYLEEQRRADNRRIAELEQDTTELRKRVETQAAKLPLIEETVGKHKAHFDKSLEQLKDFQSVIDEVRASEFRREQAAKKYVDQAEEVKKEMEEWRSQTQRFVEQFQQNKRSLEKLEGFQARLEKRQNEVAEMQRLAEDRAKRQWEEWQKARDKELKKRQLILDEQWQAQGKTNQDLTTQTEALGARTDTQQTLLEKLFDLYRLDAHRDLQAATEAVEKAEQSLSEAREAWREVR
jgi:chromosome segregation ATPase